MKTISKYSVSAVAVAVLIGLGGCAGMTQQDKGTAIGAGVGGVAGNVLGGGLLGTAAGAVVEITGLRRCAADVPCRRIRGTRCRMQFATGRSTRA